MAARLVRTILWTVLIGIAATGFAIGGVWRYLAKQWPFDPADPVVAALERDTAKLRQLERRLADIRVSHDIEAPWIVAARELEVDALYDNQTGLVDRWYRDAHFLELEALLRGATPAQRPRQRKNGVAGARVTR